MADRLTKLLPASWKGVPFLVHDEAMTEGGRRIILHEYPNSPDRFIEDQGELPPMFSVTAFVTGAEFQAKADKLEKALKDPGKGQLSMPNFGVKQVFAMPYKKDASQTEVGIIKFELSFVQGRKISGPEAAKKNAQTVFKQGDDARSKLQSAVAAVYKYTGSVKNAAAAQYDYVMASDSAQFISKSFDTSNLVLDKVNFIKNNIVSIMRDPALVGLRLFGETWQHASEAFAFANKTQDGNFIDINDFNFGDEGYNPKKKKKNKPVLDLLELTKIGSGFKLDLSGSITDVTITPSPSVEVEPIQLWPETTAPRIERNKNRLAIVHATRVSALIVAYEQAADINYDTDVEIEETRYALEVAHQRVMRVDTSNKDLVQSQPDLRQAMETLRLSALDVLDQKEQVVYGLTTVNNQVPITAYLQGYTLYAEQFRTANDAAIKGIEVRALNPAMASVALIGSTTVFQV